MAENIDVGSVMNTLLEELARRSGGRFTPQELKDKIHKHPKYNRWKVRQTRSGSEEAFWVAANPAVGIGKVFPRDQRVEALTWAARQPNGLSAERSMEADLDMAKAIAKQYERNINETKL